MWLPDLPTGGGRLEGKDNSLNNGAYLYQTMNRLPTKRDLRLEGMINE